MYCKIHSLYSYIGTYIGIYVLTIYSIYTNIHRFIKCDSTYNSYTIPPTLVPSSSPLSPLSLVSQKHLIFLLEQLWHKCTEIRSYLYYSFLIRDDDDFSTSTTTTSGGVGTTSGGGSGVERSVRVERDATMRRIKRIKDISIDDYLDITSTRGR